MTRPRFSAKAGFFSVALCLLLGAALCPIYSADAPPAAAKIVIQSAEYGDLDNDKTADVTQKVAAMVKDDNLWVIPSAKTFGDPAPGAAKKLKVGYTLDGVYHKKIANDGEPLDISARLLIRKAVYGALPDGPIAEVTEEVAAMVQKNSLSVKAGNDIFGDPASGKVKKLRIDYTFAGVAKSKTVDEDQILTISNKGD